MFHAITISEETGSEALATATLSRTMDKLGVKSGKTAFIGYDLAHEIAVGNAAGMITVRMLTGGNRTSSPRLPSEKPAFEMGKSFWMSSRSWGIRPRGLHNHSRRLGLLGRVEVTEA
jgi:FMN phosphatase YigB (HAD superfamily)